MRRGGLGFGGVWVVVGVGGCGEAGGGCARECGRSGGVCAVGVHCGNECRTGVWWCVVRSGGMGFDGV